MAVINAENARAASRNFRAIFFNELRLADNGWWRELFTVVPSDSPEEIFNFMVGNPSMREWVGDRRIKHVSQASFRLEAKEWEATISVLRSQIMYDKLSQVRLYIQGLGQAFPQHFGDFAVSLMLLGFTKNAYDGQFFFDTDHDAGDGTAYSNRTTAVFSSAAWVAARRQPMYLKEPESGGRYLRVRYTHLFAGPDAEAAIEDTFGVATLANGATNKYFNQIPAERRIIVPELGATAKWFLFDLSKPVKPFVLMIVKGVDFVALDRPEDWNVFNKKEFLYGIDSVDNAGYALWELGYGSSAGESV